MPKLSLMRINNKKVVKRKKIKRKKWEIKSIFKISKV
jgi:hypothetical protein